MRWYKHDSDANMDMRLQEVLLDYGLEGYGLYWYCLELIVNKVEIDNLTFELEHDCRIIARNTGSTPQKVTEMMTRFVELGLFEDRDGQITCIKLLKRLDKSMTSNDKFRKAIDRAKQSHDKVMMNPDSVMQDKIRLDETRQDKIRQDKPKKRTVKFIPPTIDQVKQYCVERKNNIDPESFVDHYEANGWMRGNNKIKDWKACVRTWERNNKNKPQPDQTGFDVDFMDAELWEDKHT